MWSSTVSRTVSSRRVRFDAVRKAREASGKQTVTTPRSETRPLKTEYLHLRGRGLFSVLSSAETRLSLNCDSQICQPHPSSRSHLSPQIPQTHPRARDAETSRARVAAMVRSPLFCFERHRWRIDEIALSFRLVRSCFITPTIGYTKVLTLHAVFGWHPNHP